MQNKISTLLNNYKFISIEQCPMFDESDHQTGQMFNFKYKNKDITLMYYSDKEIYLMGQEGLLNTSLQSNNLSESIASIPYALQEVIKSIEHNTFEQVA